jgi:hypothetical protein
VLPRGTKPGQSLVEEDTFGMPTAVVISAGSRRRIRRASAWLEDRAAADEVVVVGASLDAANELTRSKMNKAKRKSASPKSASADKYIRVPNARAPASARHKLWASRSSKFRNTKAGRTASVRGAFSISARP